MNLLNYKGTSRFVPVPCCTVSLDALRKLYNTLNEKSIAAVEAYLTPIPQLVDKTPEEDAQLRDEVKRLGQLTVIINGLHGEQVVSQSIDCLTAENIPDKITYIAFDSSAGLSTLNISLKNSFRLDLDFTDPQGFSTYR